MTLTFKRLDFYLKDDFILRTQGPMINNYNKTLAWTQVLILMATIKVRIPITLSGQGKMRIASFSFRRLHAKQLTGYNWSKIVGMLEPKFCLCSPLAAVSIVEANSHCCDSKCPSVNQRG